MGFSLLGSRAPPWDTLRLFVAFLHLFGFRLRRCRKESHLALAARSEPCKRFGDEQQITDHKNHCIKKSFHFYVLNRCSRLCAQRCTTVIIGVLKRVMEILSITLIHLSSIFDCKYNTDIVVL